MYKYEDYPKGLKVSLLENQRNDLKQLMDSILNYVKSGQGCSQSTGEFDQIEQVKDLSFEAQKHLAYQIKSILNSEAAMRLPKFLLSFFITIPTGHTKRADEILHQFDQKAVSTAEQWLKNGITPMTSLQSLY